MKLTEDELTRYQSDGFVVLMNHFSEDEMEILRAALAQDCEVGGPCVVREADGRKVRALYASHLRHPVFRRLVRLDRLLSPARELAGEALYVHQLKVNVKQPFGGERWSWHQDYVVWRDVDGMPGPRAVNVALFLDDMTEFNGPVIFLRGSHRLGTLENRPDGGGGRSDAHVDPDEYAVGPGSLAELIAEHEMVSAKGRAGSVVLFHPQIVHGSAANMSPGPRRLLIATYNPLDNAPRRRRDPRPEYLVGRPSDAPLTMLGGLLQAG
ncbi:phytanoyl-CoA dioxygenase family protein [Streptomyces sp. NPDC093252]|uniref:phytanoyl-CoA dioxygenase family protein n=1 Tax=Streptomyces sp. NPDC093252 TaxID=3154980 RepID=UPI00342500BA